MSHDRRHTHDETKFQPVHVHNQDTKSHNDLAIHSQNPNRNRSKSATISTQTLSDGESKNLRANSSHHNHHGHPPHHHHPHKKPRYKTKPPMMETDNLFWFSYTLYIVAIIFVIVSLSVIFYIKSYDSIWNMHLDDVPHELKYKVIKHMEAENDLSYYKRGNVQGFVVVGLLGSVLLLFLVQQILFWTNCKGAGGSPMLIKISTAFFGIICIVAGSIYLVNTFKEQAVYTKYLKEKEIERDLKGFSKVMGKESKEEKSQKNFDKNVKSLLSSNSNKSARLISPTKNQKNSGYQQYILVGSSKTINKLENSSDSEDSMDNAEDIEMIGENKDYDYTNISDERLKILTKPRNKNDTLEYIYKLCVYKNNIRKGGSSYSWANDLKIMQMHNVCSPYEARMAASIIAILGGIIMILSTLVFLCPLAGDGIDNKKVGFIEVVEMEKDPSGDHHRRHSHRPSADRRRSSAYPTDQGLHPHHQRKPSSMSNNYQNSSDLDENGRRHSHVNRRNSFIDPNSTRKPSYHRRASHLSTNQHLNSENPNTHQKRPSTHNAHSREDYGRRASQSPANHESRRVSSNPTKRASSQPPPHLRK